MILDSSAIVAILLDEPEAHALLDAMEGADVLAAGAPTLAETGIVLGARLGFGSAHLEGFVREFDVRSVAFGDEHWTTAVRAYRRYGKGRHPAALNFGDCLAYAAASLARRPLLCVGNDFARTDLELVPLGPTRR